MCFDNRICYHTETESEDQTFYLTQSQYTDSGPICRSADMIRARMHHKVVETSEVKPMFEVCTTDVDPYFRSSLLTVDR